jgi:hypothetical protein
VVLHVRQARLPRAISATVKRVVPFDAVPDDLAATVIANGRELMDRTLEAVKRMPRALRHYFERQVIIITANFTLRHCSPLANRYPQRSTKSTNSLPLVLRFLCRFVAKVFL